MGITTLIIAYILLAILLLSLNLRSNWPWPVKAMSIVLVSAFYLITYKSFPPLLGWPTQQTLPERFRVVSAHVDQPNKLTGFDGSIYLWVTEIDDLSKVTKPRAFELPYENELHEKIIQLNAKLTKNILQLGEYKEPEEGALLNVEERGRTSQVSAKIQFYDLPDPMFPDK